MIKHIISIGTPQPDKVVMVLGVEVVLKYIPPGAYWMGSFESENPRYGDETPHKVKLTQGFYMMQTPVTQRLYLAVMGKNPSCFQGNLEHPVEYVNWKNAKIFSEKVSELMREVWCLPTEAQWEWAARGGEEWIYAGSNDPEKVGWYRNNSGGTTHPVKQKQPNGFGLYDMSGNVYEWVADWFGPYTPSGNTFKADRLVDPLGNERGKERVVRGGSWGDDASSVRVALRDGVSPSDQDRLNGFRLVRSYP